jgi:hypothetical protein
MTPHEPEEPAFASPTPPASLPAPGLDDVHIPAPGAAGHDAWTPGRPPSGDETTARRRRRAMVAVGAVIVLAVTVTAAALGGQAARERAWEPLPTDLAEPRDAHAVQLVLGSCLADLPEDGPVDRVRVVPCGEAHRAQVVGRTDADPDAVWPGDETLAARGSHSCGVELLGSKQAAGVDDELGFVVWSPSEESWAGGDRTTLCLATGQAPRTGSLLG